MKKSFEQESVCGLGISSAYERTKNKLTFAKVIDEHTKQKILRYRRRKHYNYTFMY